MKLTETPVIIGNSIAFREKERCFFYSMNLRKVAMISSESEIDLSCLEDLGFFQEPNFIDNEGEPSRYSKLMLLLTQNCPLRCRFCYANAGAGQDNMPWEIADAAVSQYLLKKPSRPSVTLFGGGEPTRNRLVIEKLIAKYRNQVRWVLPTSGVMPEQFLRWLAENNVVLNFSIEGPPDIQNFLRPLKNGLPSSAIVEKSVRIWTMELNKSLTIRTTLTGETIEQIERILSYFEELGVNTLHLETLYLLGRAVGAVERGSISQPNIEDWIKIAIKALEWAKRKRKHVRIAALSYFFRPALSAYCGPICGHTLVVNHKGHLTSCSEVVDQASDQWEFFQIGELKNGFLIDEEKMTFLSQHAPQFMRKCEGCFARYVCRGGCAHKGYETTGEYLEPDPRHCLFLKSMVLVLIKRMATGAY